MDLNETAVFVKVVQAGGFSAAARQLGLPTSTVSTRVARLEKRLGVTLLPTYLCRADCQGGLLTRVLPEWQARADPVYLVYPRQRFVPPKLRAFVDLASAELRGRFE